MGTATPEAMVESALGTFQILEDLDFTDIIISLKASDVHRTVARIDCSREGRLSVSSRRHGSRHVVQRHGEVVDRLGILLHEGIGDTIRVSLRGAAGRSSRGVGDCEVAGTANAWRDGGCVSDVWAARRR
jgi:(E)-4-hydroxy-3-methylbut-2-enyl-diphosphate synthase